MLCIEFVEICESFFSVFHGWRCWTAARVIVIVSSFWRPLFGSEDLRSGRKVVASVLTSFLFEGWEK